MHPLGCGGHQHPPSRSRGLPGAGQPCWQPAGHRPAPPGTARTGWLVTGSLARLELLKCAERLKLGCKRDEAHLESIRRIDHDVLRSLGLIPGASALLIDHATVVHRHAAWRHASDYRADDGGRHGDASANRRRSRDRMVVIVPAATATAMPFDIDVDVPVDVDVVDVVDAAAADIVGTDIRPAIVDLRTLPGAAARRRTRATPAACGAAPPPPPPPPPRPAASA